MYFACWNLTMGKFSLKDRVCTLIWWALVLVCCAAEQEYFPQATRLPWDEARSHCQVCFKDLVTLTSKNNQAISQNSTSDHWIGLRKNFNSTSNSSREWSRWANGDPLAFQNWYPGWPVLKPSAPNTYSCNCSYTYTYPVTVSSNSVTKFTTPDATGFTDVTDVTESNAENMTSSGMWTDAPASTAAHTARTLPPGEASTTAAHPMLSGEASCEVSVNVPTTDDNYMEDSCVVMLSSGAWVEKDCSEHLPFICYEDRFFGQVNVTNVTTASAILTWLPGPGNISHYRLEVKGDRGSTDGRTVPLTKLTYDLARLTAGSRYSVQVFPVKCERDLSPQEVAFYTIPNKVEHLRVTHLGETSVSLRWTKPAGGVGSYLIQMHGRLIESDTNDTTEVGDLTPGTGYRFTVFSVQNKSIRSEESSIVAYTRPGRVTDLKVSENTNNSMLLQWAKPTGNSTGFRVTAMNINKDIVFNETVTQIHVRVTGLPIAAKINLSVTALANGTLEGDSVTVVNYTAPGPVSNLTLDTTHSSLTATWSPPAFSNSSFNIELLLDGESVNTKKGLGEPRCQFGGLKTAGNYTVIVSVVNVYVEGPPVQNYKFTLPLPPTDAKVTSSTKEQITFQWEPPVNSSKVMYSVKLSSSFWGLSWSDTVDTETSHTFSGLKSGTRYHFEVRTVADKESSVPKNLSHFTAADEREITLSMLCSSTQVLLCDKDSTRESVFDQLHEHFSRLLGDNVFWKLEK